MTTEQMQHRVSLLEAEMHNSLANHNALLGRIAEAKHWLSEATKPSETSEAAETSEVSESSEVKEEVAA